MSNKASAAEPRAATQALVAKSMSMRLNPKIPNPDLHNSEHPLNLNLYSRDSSSHAVRWALVLVGFRV